LGRGEKEVPKVNKILPIIVLFLLIFADFAADTIIINKPVEVPEYSYVAITLFAIGVLLSFFFILRVMGLVRVWQGYGLSEGIKGFAIGMSGVILLLYSLFYTVQASAPQYTIAGANAIVQATSISSVPLVKNSMFNLVGYVFIWIDIILSFVYIFIALAFYSRSRKEKKYSGE
jgi:hypothetical protein